MANIESEPQRERRMLEPEEFLSMAENVVSRGELLVMANDVDLTVSSGGNKGEEDPRITNLHPLSGKALKMLEINRQAIGFISNRSGWQVARMAEDAGLDHPTIIGTFGHELFKADAKNPDRGIAIINERYQPYAEPITKILTSLRTSLLEEIGINDFAQDQVEIEIPTKYGPIITERKGLSEAFPEGLATGYVFNLMQPEARVPLVNHLKEEFRRLSKTAISENPTQAIALQHVWGMNHDLWEPEANKRYSLKFEPTKKEGKAYGMLQLLRGIQEQCYEVNDDRNIGMIVFGGDSNADAQGMHAASRAAAFHNKDVIAHLPVQSIGIWVKPGHDEPEVSREADLAVDGPDGYAELLIQLANRINKLSTR